MPPKGERRKQQIIDTAKKMFMEKGFQSTHIGQVCEKLNIARGTVYQYFSNKKEILYALLDSVVEKIEDILDVDEIVDILNENPSGNYIEKQINQRISSSLTILLNEPIVIRLIFNSIAGVDREVNKRVESAVMKIRNIMAKEIEEIKRRGIFKDEIDPKITASMLFGGIMMLVFEHETKKINVLNESIVNSIVDHYLNGTLKK